MRVRACVRREPDARRASAAITVLGREHPTEIMCKTACATVAEVGRKSKIALTESSVFALRFRRYARILVATTHARFYTIAELRNLIALFVDGGYR